MPYSPPRLAPKTSMPPVVSSIVTIRSSRGCPSSQACRDPSKVGRYFSRSPKVSGMEMLSLRHTERGFAVPREGTDWAPPNTRQLIESHIWKGCER